MSNKIFTEQMTSEEARMTLFEKIEGKTKTEIEKIKAEYSKILPVILEKESNLAKEGWLIG